MDEICIDKAIELLNASAGKGIQCVLDTVAKLLGNPLLMNDVTYRLLANTENPVTDDPLWNEIMELGTFSHETVNFFSEEKFIESYAKNVVARMTSPKLKYDRTNVALFDTNGVQIANICVLACNRPFTDNDFELMRIAGDFISEQLVSCDFYTELSKVFQETVVSSLIRGEKGFDKTNEDAMVELYDGLSKYLFIAVIDVIEKIIL